MGWVEIVVEAAAVVVGVSGYDAGTVKACLGLCMCIFKRGMNHVKRICLRRSHLEGFCCIAFGG